MLNILSEQGEADAAVVAQFLDITYETAAMALLRAYRAGLVTRSGLRGAEAFRYALTDRGFERLQYLGSPPSHQGAVPSSAKSHEGDVDMRVKKLHTGLHHCSPCAYEVELTAEASLKCEDCGGRLLKGPLPEVQEDDEDDYDEDDSDEDEEG